MSTAEEKLLSLLSGQPRGLSDQQVQSLSLGSAIKFVVFLTPVYGLVMGGYGWIAGYRDLSVHLPQMFYSAVKMPLLIIITVAVSIPAFFVFNTLVNLRSEFAVAVNAIIGSLATFAIAIVSLAPFTILLYVSMPEARDSYRAAVFFNAFVFAIASLAAHLALLRSYKPLINRNSNHRTLLGVWLAIFIFVGIQSGWTLRPFIGNPHQDITFFREDSFTNAFLELVRIARSLFM